MMVLVTRRDGDSTARSAMQLDMRFTPQETALLARAGFKGQEADWVFRQMMHAFSELRQSYGTLESDPAPDERDEDGGSGG